MTGQLATMYKDRGAICCGVFGEGWGVRHRLFVSSRSVVLYFSVCSFVCYYEGRRRSLQLVIFLSIVCLLLYCLMSIF